MVENQSNIFRFPYLDNAIFSPSKIELALATADLDKSQSHYFSLNTQTSPHQ